MINNIILIEGANYDNFYPFSVLHSLWEIRVGALRVFEKYQCFFENSALTFVGRENHLASFLKRFLIENSIKQTGNALFIDTTFVPFYDTLSKIESVINAHLNQSISFKYNSKVVALYSPDSALIIEDFEKVNTDLAIEIEEDMAVQLNYIFDTIFVTGKFINDDVNYLDFDSQHQIKNYPMVSFSNADNIKIGNNVKIQPNCFLDASAGAIIIDDNVQIMSQSTIIGPCYIGENSIVKIGSKIYQETSIGEFCKVGGEIENSIIHAYSNKQHEGFLGHSYLGEWVNIGADTNVSDLKNTYSEITITLKDKQVTTGKMFIGLLCGDHTKTAINTAFTTGTVAGVCGIIVKEGYLPATIKSFAWGGKSGSIKYKFDKAIEVAKIVMARRGKELLPEEVLLLKEEYERE